MKFTSVLFFLFATILVGTTSCGGANEVFITGTPNPPENSSTPEGESSTPDPAPLSCRADVLASQIYRAFITSSSYTGNLGGLAGADGKCAQAAANAGLTGNFKAILSGDGIDAASRLIGVGQIVNLCGEIVADNPAAFLAKNLRAPIRTNESGSEWINVAWTGSYSNGTLDSSANCSNWTSNSPAGARIGRNHSGLNATFAELALDIGSTSSSCSGQLSLYCIDVAGKSSH